MKTSQEERAEGAETFRELDAIGEADTNEGGARVSTPSALSSWRAHVQYK